MNSPSTGILVCASVPSEIWLNALTQLGAKLEPSGNCPPVKIYASGLPGGKRNHCRRYFIPISLRIIDGFTVCKQSIEITLSSELNSKPYVDMTIATMSDFGVEIRRDHYSSFTIYPASYLPLSAYEIEFDASAASYFFGASAICGGTVKVENISRNSKQGDIAFLDILQRMGCSVKEGDGWIEVSSTGSLRGADVNMRDIPDTAQTLAAIAPFGSSPTRIRGIASARSKRDRSHPCDLHANLRDLEYRSKSTKTA